MRFLWVFRLSALGAVLLGLVNLFLGAVPRWAIDIHMLFGMLAVVSAWRVLWTLRGGSAAPVGMGLAAVMLILGLGLRFLWWGGLAVGLVHFAVGLATIGLVEMISARARRAAPPPQ